MSIKLTPWQETLTLWKRMSEIPDCKIESGSLFKKRILSKLGICNRQHGCPLCDRFWCKRDCPLGDCSNEATPCYSTPYADWETYIHEGWHSQERAKKFYDFLLKKEEAENKDIR